MYSYASCHEHSRSKGSGGQGMGKLGKMSAWNLTKFRRKKEVFDEARTSGAKVHFASLMDIWKNAELEANQQNNKGRVVLRGDLVKDDSGSYAVFTEQGSSASQVTAAKVMDITSRLPGCARQAADAVCVYTQVKVEDATNYCKFQNRSVQTFGFVHHDKMAQIMVQYRRPSCSSWTESVWSSFGRTVMGKTIWENPIEAWLGENSKLGVSPCSSWKRVFHICVCGCHKIGWKETKSWSNVETTQQRSPFGRTNIFPWSCILGMHSKTMWNKQRYCGQLQSHVRIANFRGGSREITIRSKSSFFFMVLWHGWSCKEVCGTIWWVGKQEYWTTLQSIYSMHRWPPLQRRRNKIYLLENCQKHAVKLFWHAYIWHELDDLIFYSQWTNLHDRSQNWPKLVTNAWIDWFHTFVTHVNTNSIAMLVILQNNEGWDCFKTPIVREILRIQNALKEEHCAFLEVIHLFQ